MIKMIFYILIIGIFAFLFSDTFTNTFVMISTAITAITSALNLILAIIIVPFNSMLSFYYIKLALYIGVLFFVISYVLKLITGHHLMTEEDIEEEIISVNYLDSKVNKMLPMPSRTKDLYSSKQTYEPWHNLKVINAKKENKLYESNLKKEKKIKNHEKEIMDTYLQELEDFRKQIRERRKKK